jgi:hypothetical protein
VILVRLVFQAQFGKAADVVAGFKQFGSQAGRPGGSRARHVRLLTDLSGQFDTVVQELEFDSYEDWQKDMEAMFADPRMREAMAGTGEHISGGYKEFYTIEMEQ